MRSRARSSHRFRPECDTLEGRQLLTLTLTYDCERSGTLNLLADTLIAQAPRAANTDAYSYVAIDLTKVPGVKYGQLSLESGATSIPWGTVAPNPFEPGAGKDRVYSGETLTYTNNGFGQGKGFLIPITFSDVTGFHQTSANLLIKIVAPGSAPKILTQPKALSVVAIDGAATLSVSASGTGTLHYQWYQGVAPDGEPIAGATLPTYTTPVLTEAIDYDYWVQVSSQGLSTDSLTATVSVGNPTVLTALRPAAVSYSPAAQQVALQADVTCPDGALVTDGQVTFTAGKLGSVVGNVTNGVASASLTLPAGTNPQSLPITESYIGSSEFLPSHGLSILTIVKANQTIQLQGLGAGVSPTVGDSFTIVSTSGLPVTFHVSNPKETVQGNTVTLVKAGAVTLTASQLGNIDYNPAPSLDLVWTVTANHLPVLGALSATSITATPGQAGPPQTVTVTSSDRDNDPVTISASAESLNAWLAGTYQLYLDPGGDDFNQRGGNEVYLRGKVSAHSYDTGGQDPYYYILPNGRLMELTPPYGTSLTGGFVAQVGTDVYHNPSLITGNPPNTPPVLVSMQGNQVVLTPVSPPNAHDLVAGTIDEFELLVTASDGKSTRTRDYRMSITDANTPALAPVADQIIAGSPHVTLVRLSGSGVAPASGPRYSVSAEPLTTWLNLTYKLYPNSGGTLQNLRGQSEIYLRGKVSASGLTPLDGQDPWYFLLPNGDLYEELNHSAIYLFGKLVASLGADVYNHPTQLTGATSTSVDVTVAMLGSQVEIAPDSTYQGTFVVIPSYGDGIVSASQPFKVTVTPPGQPFFEPIVPQTVFFQDPVKAALTVENTGILKVQYSATIQTVEAWLAQNLGLTRDAALDDSRGQHEEYFTGTSWFVPYYVGTPRAANPLYYILPDGELYELIPPYVTGSPLNGVLVAELDPQDYQDPTRISASYQIPVGQFQTEVDSGQAYLVYTPPSGSKFTGNAVITVTAKVGQTSLRQLFPVYFFF